MIDGDPDPTAQELAGKILPLTQETGIYSTYEPAELRLLNAPWGSLPRRERVALGWAVEGIAVMAWALGKADLPCFDTRCEGAPVGSSLGLFQHAPGILRDATLRDPLEIQARALTYEILSWRLERFLDDRQRIDFASRLKDSAIYHSIAGGFTLLEDGDLAVDGAPLIEISDERLFEVCTIVRERHKAFRWLLGYEKNYAALTTIN
jgi:hypothetical protein